MKEKKKKTKILIISIILILALAGYIYYLFFSPRAKNQREIRELSERISSSKQEYDNFLNEKDKELQEKLDLLDKGYNVPTKSYFSSPENIKLRYNLKEKGYKFDTVTVKNENSTYFQNDNYFILGIIDINKNEIIDVSFRNKNLKTYACSVLDINNIDTEEKKEQYNSYLQWIKENNLTLGQLKSVLLDYYLDNK